MTAAGASTNNDDNTPICVAPGCGNRVPSVISTPKTYSIRFIILKYERIHWVFGNNRKQYLCLSLIKEVYCVYYILCTYYVKSTGRMPAFEVTLAAIFCYWKHYLIFSNAVFQTSYTAIIVILIPYYHQNLFFPSFAAPGLFESNTVPKGKGSS